MKRFICIFFLGLIPLYGLDYNFGISGNLDYTQQKSQNLIHQLDTEFRIKMYESSDKKCLIFFGGSIEHNYNVFQKSYHINGFTQLGIEF